MKTSRGFTLIELIVTMMVAAIIVAFAVPSFQNMLMNSRLTSQTDALANALNYARSTALNQNVATEICPVGAINSTTCGSAWSAGWMVVLNPVGNPPTPATALLQSIQSPPGAAVVSSSTTSITFDSRGLATTPAQFVICDSRGSSFARSVQVQATGFVQAGATPGTAAWGGAITCP